MILYWGIYEKIGPKIIPRKMKDFKVKGIKNRPKSKTFKSKST